jgi:hypothetical protein
MKKIFDIQDRQTALHYLKRDFISAYNNNGENINLALSQVANLRKVEVSYVKSILSNYIGGLTMWKDCDASEVDLY